MAEGEMSWLPKNGSDKACDHPKEYMRYQEHGHHIKYLPSEPVLPIMQSKSGLKPHPRPRKVTNWAAGGPGMQAIFLDSGHRSCGTGVFLPRRQDTDFQPCQKPDMNNKSDGSLVGNKKCNDASTQCYVVSQNCSSSPEIFLPKEWTY